jgi:photosystem II stability/assembly factor-like uncharacterized protein
MPRTSTRFRRAALAACLVLACQIPARAATERWVPFGPDLSSVHALAVSRTGLVYAGVAERGVFESDDGGSQWTLAATGGSGFSVRDLAIDPGDPRQVYALTDRGLFRAAAGAWNYVGPGYYGFGHFGSDAFAVAPSDRNRLYVVDDGELLVSRDRGASWHGPTANLGFMVDVLRVDPRGADVLYAGNADLGNSDGLLKSVDGGVTWHAGSGPGGAPGPSRVLSFAFDPRQPDVQYAGTLDNGIWKSTDAGETWSRVLPTASLDVVTALAVDPGDGDRIYAAIDHFASDSPPLMAPMTGEIWRSEDGGATWARMAVGQTAVRALAVDPTDPRRAYAGFEQDGVLASGNRGASWHPARRGLRAFTASDVAVDPHREGSLWIAVSDSRSSDFFGSNDLFPAVVYPGLFHSVDGGRTWTASGRGFDPSSSATRIVFDPVRRERLFALTSPTAILHRSTDGGASWQALFSPVYSGVNLLVIDPVSPDTLYAAGDDVNGSPAVLKSVDGGETWADLSGGFETGTGDRAFTGLTIRPDRPATLYASCTAGFFRSLTAGRRWTRLASGESEGVNGPIVIDPLDTARMFAFGGTNQDHQLIKSTDRGVTWRPTSLKTGPGLSVLVADSHHLGTFYDVQVVGAADGRPFVSDDGGATWRPLAAGLGPAAQGVNLATDPHLPGRLYLSLRSSGLFTLTR